MVFKRISDLYYLLDLFAEIEGVAVKATYIFHVANLIKAVDKELCQLLELAAIENDPYWEHYGQHYSRRTMLRYWFEHTLDYRCGIFINEDARTWLDQPTIVLVQRIPTYLEDWLVRQITMNVSSRYIEDTPVLRLNQLDLKLIY